MCVTSSSPTEPSVTSNDPTVMSVTSVGSVSSTYAYVLTTCSLPANLSVVVNGVTTNVTFNATGQTLQLDCGGITV